MNNVYLFFFLIILYSCANEVAPSGGDKDIAPPELKWEKPWNGNINFSDKTIVLKFDEFIKFKSSADYVFISPPLKEKPKYTLNGKKIIIQFKEDLLPNTTYSINFNEAIEDFNEGNVLSNFNYVFSTGSYLDSLSISGTVLDAFDKKPLENILVLLYPEDFDSVLYKKPQYFTKTNKDGSYSINNLKEGNYKIACLEDKNLNYIFDQNNERIDFRDEVIVLTEDVIASPFFLFQNIKENSILDNNLESNHHLIVSFSAPFSKLDIDISNYSENDIIYYGKDKKSLHYWFQEKDTSSLFFFNIDGSLDTLNLDLRQEKNTDSLFTLSSSFYLFNETNNISIASALPIKKINKNKISLLKIDSTEIPFSYSLEENNSVLKIETETSLDSLYLNINEAALFSFNNKMNATLNENLFDFIPTKSNLIINLPIQTNNIVVELFNIDLELIDTRIVSRETSISFNNIDAGKYFIRIFEDLKNNGFWDSGMFHVKQLPEKTLFYSSEIDLKANWDKEIDIKF